MRDFSYTRTDRLWGPSGWTGAGDLWVTCRPVRYFIPKSEAPPEADQLIGVLTRRDGDQGQGGPFDHPRLREPGRPLSEGMVL